MKQDIEASYRPEKRLVELAVEANAIYQVILQSNGELTPEVEAWFNANSKAIVAKIDAYGFVEEKLKNDADFWERRVDANKMMHDRVIKSHERLRQRVKSAMKELGRKEIKGNFHRYTLSDRAAKLVISDAKLLPSECMMIVTDRVPDKEKIKSLLEEGFSVPGAHLEPVSALRGDSISEED